jgi:hypothetical protein
MFWDLLVNGFVVDLAALVIYDSAQQIMKELYFKSNLT